MQTQVGPEKADITLMSSVSSIARSGMTAALARVGASANNIANQQTPGYRRRQLLQSETPGGGVDTTTVAAGSEADGGGSDGLATDLIQQKAASYDFKANLRVLQTEQDMLGTLLDTHA
jgi:flagellar hook-associated protein FlgK